MIKGLLKLRIDERLAKSSKITTMLSAAVSVVCVLCMIFVLLQYGKILDNYAFPQGDIGHAMAALANMQSATRGMVAYSDRPNDIEYFVKEYDTSKTELDTYVAAIAETIVSEQGEKDYAEICKLIKEYEDVNTHVIEHILNEDTDKHETIVNEHIEHTEHTDEQNIHDSEVETATDHLLEEVLPAYNKAYMSLQALMDTNVALGDSERSSLVVLDLICAGIAFAIVGVAMKVSLNINKNIAKSITDPLNQLSQRLDTFKDGDLYSLFPEYENNDEIGDMILEVKNMADKLGLVFNDLQTLLEQMADRNFNIKTSCEDAYTGDFKPLLLATRKMNRQMDVALKEVRSASEMVSAGASNLAEASQALAEGATDQAAAVEEMQATINEITNGMEQSAIEVNEAYKDAKETADQAESSRIEMAVLMEAMDRISETSLQIGTVITEIESIAEQTNLLSLNASIEAARAGEAGRGFAVVAGEIGKLAAQSAKAAVNTRELIEGSIREIETGNKVAAQTSEVLAGVVEAIQSIAQTAKKLSETSTMQAEMMEQAEEGVARISEVVQSNSATAEEASATSEELSAQAVSMDELVSKFKLRD